ncbi:MAG: trypsin-like serine protease [Streptococcaceae bacterium]|jgi:V8-like Glu-specific endopeptidase|nr:trypsin-like serine protease [Streptococcaceae bacterium]
MRKKRILFVASSLLLALLPSIPINDSIIVNQSADSAGKAGFVPAEMKAVTHSQDDTGLEELVEPESLPPATMNAIIGQDERSAVSNTTQFPYSAVAYIKATFPNGTVIRGSAALISQDTVLTAAHMIYDLRYGGKAKTVEVYPGASYQSAPYGSASSYELYVPKEWEKLNLNGYNESYVTYDYGVIKLSSPIGKRTGYLGYNSLDSVFPLFSIGYPGPDPAATTYNLGNQVISTRTSEGTPVLNRAGSFQYDFDTTCGSSGSPILNQSNVIYGIVSGGISGIVNFGVRLNATNISFINRVRNLPLVYDTLYRMYNKNSGEHFYTKNYSEATLLIQKGWQYEGIGWSAPKTSSSPVYRIYNPNEGVHHYTKAVGEKDILVKLGWHDEGIGWYSDTAMEQRLYRQYNPNNGQHNYTANTGERDYLVSQGWHSEGTAWYGLVP